MVRIGHGEPEPPDLAALGGIDGLLASDPGRPPVSLDMLIVALVSEDALGERVSEWLVRALGAIDEPIVFSRSLEVLVPAFGDSGAAEVLVAELLDRARARSDPREGYVAAEALDAAMVLLLGGCADARRLDAAQLLRDVRPDDDQAFALRAATAAGIAFAHWPEQIVREALSQGLNRLLDHPDAGVDALYELGQTQLVHAIEADDRAEVLRRLADAQATFDEAANAEEERVDAAFMGAALLALRRFMAGDDRDALKNAVEAAEECMRERGLYGRGAALSTLSRRAEEALWGILLDQLAAIADELDEPAWTHGARVVADALEAVRASRAVKLAPLADTDLSSAVIPRIEAPFVRHQQQRLLLQRVLDEEELDEALAREAELILAKANDPPKVEGAEAPLAQLLGPNEAEALNDMLRPELRGRLDEMLSATLPDFARDAQWVELFGDVIDNLDGSPDFTGALRPRLTRMVAHLIGFVSYCIKFELGFEKAMSYLGDPNAHEREMANHLVRYLIEAGVGPVHPEVRHEGMGGRVDVLITLGTDRFVIECKRDADAVGPGEVDPYLEQTELYLSSSIRIGALAILDLSEKSGVPRGLDGSVWVVNRPSVEGAAVRKVICLVVAGNRKQTPSARSR